MTYDLLLFLKKNYFYNIKILILIVYIRRKKSQEKNFPNPLFLNSGIKKNKETTSFPYLTKDVNVGSPPIDSHARTLTRTYILA